MDGRQPDYPQSGLSSPYAPYTGHQSEPSSADPTSAVQYQPGQDYKSNHFSSGTPESNYGLSSSARSGSFPEYIQRSYADGTPTRYPQGPQSGHAAMAQTSSPSLSMPNGPHINGHTPGIMRSDEHVPIDPSIAQSSPSYPPQHNYSPYPPQHEMPQYGGQPMPQYGRPEWAGQYQQPMAYGHPPATSGGPGHNMVAHAIPRPPAVGYFHVSVSMILSILTNLKSREAIHFRPFTRSSPFPVLNSTSDHVDDMKKLKECTNAAGMVAKRHMAR